MIRALVLGFFIFVNVFSIGTLEVDVEELKENIKGEIVFINYEGKHEKIDTAEEIKAVGWLLAGALEQDKTKGTFLFKYSIIRAVDPAEKGKLDADIFSIDRDAKVDHIDNVRRILSGYLEGTYGYSNEDARLLAEFATIYNAVFRGDMDFFTEKYKSVVLSHLAAGSAGISTLYSDWPGATRMVIPLTEKAAKGEISALSTSELTEEKVIEEMRKQEDMGLEDRKEMVEFKEKEVDEKKAEAELEKQRLEEEKARVAEAERLLSEEKAKLDTEAPAEEAAVKAKEEELKAQEAELAGKKEELKDREAELAKTQEEIAGKEGEISKEREQIIKDELTREEMPAIEKTVEPGAAAQFFSDKLYYARIRRPAGDGSLTSTLSILDPNSWTVDVTSPVTHLSGRRYYFFKETILVIAHEGDQATRAHLMLLDPYNLRPVKSSKEPIYPNSFAMIQSGSVYAVLEEGGSFKLGRFDENLSLAAGSALEVDRDSAFSFFGEQLYVSAPDGSILVLDRKDLSRQGLIK